MTSQITTTDVAALKLKFGDDEPQPTFSLGCRRVVRHTSTLVIVLGVTAAFIFLFSFQGMGVRVINDLSHEPRIGDDAGEACAILCHVGIDIDMGLGELLMYASCCLLVCLYVFDFSNWDGPSGRAMQRLCVCLVVAGITVYALFSADVFPELPMACFALMLPVAVVFLRQTVLAQSPGDAALRSVGYALLVAGAGATATWGWWVAHGNAWTDANKHRFTEAIECGDRWDIDRGDVDYTVCRAAFMLWLSPALVAGMCFTLAAVVLALARSLVRVNPWAIVRTVPWKVMAKTRPGSRTLAKRSVTMGSVVQEARVRARLHEATEQEVETAYLVLKALAYAGVMLLVVLYAVARLAGSGMMMAQGVFTMCGIR